MAAAPEVSATASYTDYEEIDRSRTTLFIIDPQRDFHPGGSLAIPTANEDAERIAALITTHVAEIDDLVVSLDTHQRLHVAHGLFWKDAQGNHPEPFTLIPSEAVESGSWSVSKPKFQDWGLEYTRALEAGGNYTLCIWPEHCVLGTAGHAVVPQLTPALDQWAEHHTRAIEFVLKGHNMLTEHYSAMQAEVVRDDDPRTQFNQRLFERLLKADRVVVCGQALSHCVKFTVKDLVKHWPTDQLSKLVLLTDCASPVVGFEDAAASFVAEMREAGVTVTTSAELSW